MNILILFCVITINILSHVEARFVENNEYFISNNGNLLSEINMITMLEGAIKANNAEQVRYWAEKIIKIYPDNEKARIALLALNENDKEYVEKYLVKYPNDICGKYVYMKMNKASEESYIELVENVRTIISREEFYKIIKPTVILNTINVYNFEKYSKERYIMELFEDTVGLVVYTVEKYDDSKYDDMPIYSLPQYDKKSDVQEILKDYAIKYPPEYFSKNEI